MADEATTGKDEQQTQQQTTQRTVAGVETKTTGVMATGSTEQQSTTDKGGQEQADKGKQEDNSWRERMADHVAAGDKKARDRELKRLARFTSPEAVYGSYKDIEAKFSEGGLTKIPGKDAKPEDIAAFHKSLGVPEKPEEYFKDLDLGDGRVIGEQDKPIADSFAAAMHPAGATKAQVAAAMKWFYDNQEQAAAAQEDHDEKTYAETMKAIKEELGASAKRQIVASHALFRDAPGGTDIKNPNSLIAQFFTARLPNGNLVGNDPEMVKLLVKWNKELNPAESVMENTGGGSSQSIADELAAIRKTMREDRRAYNADTNMQARYRELVAAQQKEQQRNRAA